MPSVINMWRLDKITLKMIWSNVMETLTVKTKVKLCIVECALIDFQLNCRNSCYPSEQ